MPDAVQFVCQSCRDEEIPEWLDSVRQEIQAGYVYVCYVYLYGFKHRKPGLARIHPLPTPAL